MWGVVNAVNLLQATGFISRVPDGDMTVNHLLGYFMFALAVPASFALIILFREGAGWLHLAGPSVYLAFLSLMLVVDYACPVEFRSPPFYGILVPYLVLFFGSILLMGLPMFRLDRRLWFVTAVTTTLLLVAMSFAMSQGVA